MWCIIVWNTWWKNWLAILPSKYQEISCRQQFVFRLHLQNPRWDWAQITSATFHILQNRCQSKGDAVFRQNLHSSRISPEYRPAHSSIHPHRHRASVGGTWLQHLSNDRIVSKHWKKRFKQAPSQWTSTGKCTVTKGKYEKEIEPVDLLYLTNSSSRSTCSNAFKIVNTIVNIWPFIFFIHFREAELLLAVLKKSPLEYQDKGCCLVQPHLCMEEFSPPYYCNIISTPRRVV